MQLGSSAIYQRARLRPKDTADYVRAQYEWYCDVYTYSKKALKPEDVKLPAGVPEEMKEQLRELLAAGDGSKRHDSFESWLNDQEDIEIQQKGKAVSAKGSKLPFQHWIYTKPVNWTSGEVGTMYCEAAVYDFEDSQAAVVILMPLETKTAKKPKSKWYNIIKKVIRSGETCEEEDDSGENDKRDKYADTDVRKAALAAAKANIAGLQGWDYFTMPNYMVFYSWDFEKPDTRFKSRKEAIFYSERLEKMRNLYIESYPLDETGTRAIMPDPSTIPGVGGPITGGDTKKPSDTAAAEAGAAAPKADEEPLPYPVFRLCATYEQFQKYGQSPPGVVGWFSPQSKELVVFLGGDQMMGQGATETVTYHEGWHQFADLYFHHPDSEQHASLHRWFDEGHGDYFGSFRWGSSGWSYKGSKMRYQDCKQMVRVGDYVPLNKIVNFTRQQFYGPKASYYYAQAFSMIDFLRRGEGSKGWDERLNDVLDMYRRVALVKGDTKLGVELAFRGFTDADWKALEEAWKAWVNSGKFLKG